MIIFANLQGKVRHYFVDALALQIGFYFFCEIMNNKITENPTKTDREEEPELEHKNPKF